MLLGCGWGAFIAADWAFACTLMPKQQAGSYMGIWDVTTLLPQIIAPVIAGPLFDSIVNARLAEFTARLGPASGQAGRRRPGEPVGLRHDHRVLRHRAVAAAAGARSAGLAQDSTIGPAAAMGAPARPRPPAARRPSGCWAACAGTRRSRGCARRWDRSRSPSPSVKLIARPRFSSRLTIGSLPRPHHQHRGEPREFRQLGHRVHDDRMPDGQNVGETR